MGYSALEQRYMDRVLSSVFPDVMSSPEPMAAEPSLDGVQLAAADVARLPEVVVTGEPEVDGPGGPAGQVQPRTDAPQGFGEIKAADPQTNRQKLSSFLTDSLVNLGADRYKARERVESFVGGQSSRLPLGIGIADFVPFLGTFLQTEEALDLLGKAKDAAGRGDVKSAAIEGAVGAVSLIPGAAATIRYAKPAVEGVKAAGKALAPKAGEMIDSYLTKTGAVLKMAPDSPGIEVSAAPKLNTPAFKKWFGDSKVVDAKGNPLRMYHGTTKDFKKFKVNLTPDDHVPGISLTEESGLASAYSGEKSGANVIPVYVSAKKPIKYPDLENWVLQKAKEKNFKIKDEQDFAAFDVPPKTLLQWLKEDGYDAIDYRDDPMLGYGLRVFSPNQIKSVFNKGTFDPKDPRILHGGGAVGIGAAMQGEEKK